MKTACILAIALVACSSDPIPLGPDPSGSGSVSNASSSASSGAGGSDGGTQGAGGGLSCDPCESVDGSRIVRRKTTITSSDGLHAVVDVSYLAAGFYDTDLQTPCSALQTSDASIRCVPGSAVQIAPTIIYSDAGCVSQVLESASGQCAASSPTYFTTTTSVNVDPCKGTAYRVWRVGAPYSGPLYSKAGACSTYQAKPGYTYFSVTGEVQPAEMAPMTVETK